MTRAPGQGVGIVGLSACLPRHIRTNDWWPAGWSSALTDDPIGAGPAQAAQQSSDPSWEIARQWVGDPFHGAIERRVIDDAHESSDLEVAACTQALTTCDMSPAHVDLMIGYTQVPDDAALGNHGIVAERLGLEERVFAMSIETGCASFVSHLLVGAGLTSTHPRALLYQSSATSRVTDYSRPESPVTGDAATAQVLGRVDDGLGMVDGLATTHGELRDGIVLAPSDGRRRWYAAGPEPTAMHIAIRDRSHVVRMGALGPEYCRQTCETLLSRNDVDIRDVDFFVTAQPGAWFGAACAAKLGIDEDRFIAPQHHFQRYGHALAASAPLNLWVAWTHGRLRPGDLVLIYSPGVGFTMAAALLRWSLEPPATAQGVPATL